MRLLATQSGRNVFAQDENAVGPAQTGTLLRVEGAQNVSARKFAEKKTYTKQVDASEEPQEGTGEGLKTCLGPQAGIVNVSAATRRVFARREARENASTKVCRGNA